jgi:hypothetical protein
LLQSDFCHDVKTTSQIQLLCQTHNRLSVHYPSESNWPGNIQILLILDNSQLWTILKASLANFHREWMGKTMAHQVCEAKQGLPD